MKLRGRITLHFLLQLLVTFMATFLILVFLFLSIVHLFTKEEIKSNPTKAIVENLPISTLITDDKVTINDSWVNQLKDHKMWMQIVNNDGDVIYNVNTPDTLQDTYTINELLFVEENSKLGPYHVETYFESWEINPYYYLFGYIEEEKLLLEEWHHSYSEAGFVPADDISPFTKLLKKHHGMIEIYEHGELKQTIGEDIHQPTGQLDILGRIHAPGNHQTKAFVLNDDENNVVWTFHVVNDTYKESKLHFFADSELKIILFAMLISLLIAVILSLWHGYRYGKPLMLLIHWLSIMEQKRYHNVLSGKEHNRIYKKNGKVKLRYRLYKEVFQSLSHLTEKLSLAEKERAQLEKTREDWMAGISHDLRTPLSSVQGYGHMLESNQYDYSREELQQIGRVIRSQSDYMVDLVNDFSLVFQLKNSAITIQKTMIDINGFVEEIVMNYKDDLAWKDYRLSFQPASYPCKVGIDPKWFVRVLDNILANAIKHNPVHTEICVSVVCQTNKTMITIADNGKGMEPEVVKNLFNRYYRGTSTNTRTEGEGLGMSIASAIVDLHDGKLQVESSIDKGTTISIILFH